MRIYVKKQWASLVFVHGQKERKRKKSIRCAGMLRLCLQRVIYLLAIHPMSTRLNFFCSFPFFLARIRVVISDWSSKNVNFPNYVKRSNFIQAKRNYLIMHKVTSFVRFISILIVLISLGKQYTLQYNLILVCVVETHTSAQVILIDILSLALYSVFFLTKWRVSVVVLARTSFDKRILLFASRWLAFG